MNQYRFWNANKFQVYISWEKKQEHNPSISWCQVLLHSGPVSTGSLLVPLAIVLLAV